MTNLTKNFNHSSVIDMAEGVTRFMREKGYYPHVSEVSSTVNSEITIDGKKCINFYSNSFLGLCNHPKIIEAKKNALDQYGTGTASSRIIATQTIHLELEQIIAEFKHRESAIILSAGQLVNIGVIPALASSPLKNLINALGDNDLFGSVTIFLDRDNHSCIFDGAALSIFNFWGVRSKVKIYEHLDMQDLRGLLINDTSDRKIIITDGVFSIHGHLAPLKEIVALAKEFKASVYVDDAHGTGVLGPNGRGTAEELGVDADIDVPVGTFSKALANSGGFVVGSKDFCDYLRVSCRTYLYQTAMPPDEAAGLIAAIKVIKEEPWRREQVLANATKVRNEFERLGFSTLGTKYHIVPALIRDAEIVAKIEHDLCSQGIIAGAIKPPVVFPNEAIMRCNMMATHTEEDLDRLVTAMEICGKKYGVI